MRHYADSLWLVIILTRRRCTFVGAMIRALRLVNDVIIAGGVFLYDVVGGLQSWEPVKQSGLVAMISLTTGWL